MEIDSKNLVNQIARAKGGHQAAFRFLLDTFWIAVYNYQLKLTKNENEAEDITIQTFSKAFEKIDTFVVCAQLCGEAHANMKGSLEVIDGKEYYRVAVSELLYKV